MAEAKCFSSILKQETVKHGAGHVMILRCMSFREFGKMSFIEVKQYILRNNLCNNGLKLAIPNSYYFQKD